MDTALLFLFSPYNDNLQGTHMEPLKADSLSQPFRLMLCSLNDLISNLLCERYSVFLSCQDFFNIMDKREGILYLHPHRFHFSCPQFRLIYRKSHKKSRLRFKTKDGFLDTGKSLLHQHHPLRIGEFTGGQPIEIDPAGHTFTVPFDLMVTGLLLRIDKNLNHLSQ